MRTKLSELGYDDIRTSGGENFYTDKAFEQIIRLQPYISPSMDLRSKI